MNWRGTFIYGVILFYSVLLIFVIEGADSSVRVLFVTEQISFRWKKTHQIMLFGVVNLFGSWKWLCFNGK